MELTSLEKEIESFVLDYILKQKKIVPIGISARHVHLSREHLDVLFGKNYQLTKYKDLSQPGQFASNEKVTLITEKNKIDNVRVLGPVRPQSQVELSRSDIRKLGLKGFVRSSGDIKGTEGITIQGPKGVVDLSEGVIIADRHIHMNIRDAKRFNVVDGQIVRLKVGGPKGGILDNVKIRVSENYALDCHIDTDDANAFGIKNGDLLEVIY